MKPFNINQPLDTILHTLIICYKNENILMYYCNQLKNILYMNYWEFYFNRRKVGTNGLNMNRNKNSWSSSHLEN